jgi:hypothetical protein
VLHCGLALPSIYWTFLTKHLIYVWVMLNDGSGALVKHAKQKIKDKNNSTVIR